ncbi:MAG: preprotein translocase subunit YajC [Phycisphaerae bacterium]
MKPRVVASFFGSLCLVMALLANASSAIAANQPAIATAKPALSSAAAPAAVPAPTAAPTASAKTVPSTVHSKSGTAASQPTAPSGSMAQAIFGMWPLALMLIVIFFFMSSGRKREQKKRDQMYSALKRGSRVVTAGGLIASVVEVRDEEVVLKVDEANNIKERYTKSAIIKVLDEGDAAPDKK